MYLIFLFIGLLCLYLYWSSRKVRQYQRAMKRWEKAIHAKAIEYGYDLNAKDGMYNTKMLLLKGEVGEEPNIADYL